MIMKSTVLILPLLKSIVTDDKFGIFIDSIILILEVSLTKLNAPRFDKSYFLIYLYV